MLTHGQAAKKDAPARKGDRWRLTDDVVKVG
jgi:hypothetical protein